MSKENAEIVVFEPSMPITQADLAGEQARIALLKEFVRAQMVESVDYGIIPGTKTQSLFQPGAQKLAKIFGLGVRIVNRDREIDPHANFAMFSYTQEAYHLRSGKTIAQCEGSANSHEKKYRTRFSNGAKEETPIGDIMNTLMKMAQKRAYVGAVIQATGASDFYTQDIDSPEDAEALGIRKEPTRAKASIPKATSAKSTDEGSSPVCCGKPMMVSKYHENTYYCVNCKSMKPMEGA